MKKFLKRNWFRFFPPKEIKGVMDVLNEMEKEFDSPGFQLVKKQLKKAVLANPDVVVHNIKQSKSSREWVYVWVINIAGDYVESGHFHMYRGLIDSMGPGGDLLKLYNEVMDELVEIGAIEKDRAKKEKKALHGNIKNVG